DSGTGDGGRYWERDLYRCGQRAGVAGDDCGLAAGGVGHDPAHHAPLPTDEDAMILRQSTAVTVEVGPFLDSTDGSTAETGLTITQPDIRLSKNGGGFAQKSAAGTATHMENG